MVKGRILAFISTVFAAAGFTVLPAPVEATPDFDFQCKRVDGRPTTVVRNSQGEYPFIRWFSDEFDNWPPSRRCAEVTDRLNTIFSNTSQTYITTGRWRNHRADENGIPVICATDRKGGSCTNLIYTLRLGQDPNLTLDKLLTVSVNVTRGAVAGGEVVWEGGSCRLYVSIDSIIAGTPHVESDGQCR